MVVIGDYNLQQIVELAGQKVTFEHFRHVLDLVGKPLHESSGGGGPG